MYAIRSYYEISRRFSSKQVLPSLPNCFSMAALAVSGLRAGSPGTQSRARAWILSSSVITSYSIHYTKLYERRHRADDQTFLYIFFWEISINRLKSRNIFTRLNRRSIYFSRIMVNIGENNNIEPFYKGG